MLTLDSLLADLPPRPTSLSLLGELVPPPRFQDSSFASYRPDGRYPSQALAVARLSAATTELGRPTSTLSRIRARIGGASRGRGVYLDGGFGVGKTHLLAALWNSAPGPKAYLSFDELAYAIGLLGVGGARKMFRGLRLAAVDEWELDDPGNLKLALAWLRGSLTEGVLVAVTSNTLPDELGRGRFSQKSFTAEIEELATSFEVITIAGEDYRHRHFQTDPGREYFTDREELERISRRFSGRALCSAFPALLQALRTVHPIRFGELVGRIDALLITNVQPIGDLADGLRWVHFVDKLYDAAVSMAASGSARLADLFPARFRAGAYAKKFGRCISRMEELLGTSGGER